MAITFLLPRLRRKWPWGAALCSAVFLCRDGHFPRAFFLATSHSFDLFDPTVRSFIRRGSERAQCHGKPNFLTIRNGSPFIPPRELRQHGVLPEDLVCFYSEIYRNESVAVPDKRYMKGRRKRLSFDKPLKEEFLFVECSRQKSPENTFHTPFLLNSLLEKNVEK
ncbi:hypothetical protein MRX96_017930 [Rhipicephalus microplus]